MFDSTGSGNAVGHFCTGLNIFVGSYNRKKQTLPESNLYRILFGNIVFLLLHTGTNAQYQLHVQLTDHDSTSVLKSLGLQTSFKTRSGCADYVANLTTFLQLKGYTTASVDSVYFDSSAATIQLYLGELYQIGGIKVSDPDKKILELASGSGNELRNKVLNGDQLQAFQRKILDYLENNGYPFAKLHLDSIRFEREKIFGSLKIEKGPLYKIDSIRVYGKAVISKTFLQRYLEIRNGSLYQKTKLQNISRKILEVPYLEEQQPWNLTMLGTGSIINLYLQPKKSSQVNVLIGFLPSNQQTSSGKLLVTGEANIHLRNALGSGELIAVDWQQLQVKSPRLNLAFRLPYLLGSAFGVSTAFDLFKKDSSYLNLSFLLGMEYNLSGDQNGRIFFQNLKSNLLNVDTLSLKANKKLPPEMDVSSVNLGVDYEINRTNYRLNPRRGSAFQLTMSAGTRNIKKNNVITKLYDPSFSYESLYDTIQQKSYQFRVKFNAAHYFQLGRQSTLKTAINGGWFQSQSVFRNELFQIGGYKLLRGFDEEGIFASQYAVGTLEYRYLIGLNSFLFAFIDAGHATNKSIKPVIENKFIGAGLGMAFETKAGVFNISYAAGKRNDVKFDLRQSKIHLGYVNYF